MTQPPHIDGLPLWAQIAISLLFGLAALGAAYKGYFTRSKPDVQAGDKQTAAILGASIADMGAIRHLSDCVIQLQGTIERLRSALDEHTHHERNSIELERELCARLRELREVLEKKRR